MEKNEFISVIKQHRNLIYKICSTYCQNPDNRKDIEQEILLQLWRSFQKFDGRVKMSTWIYKVALNTAVYYYRNDRKRTRGIAINEAVISLPDEEYNTDLDREIALVYQFIEKLNEIDKALVLLYLDNYKYKEIANVLGISETNVGSKISRIKKYLKDQFANHQKIDNHEIR
ncbi:sigma-70 family RNA polymerase sigma factor [Fulvivirgaceae bacterium BMA12]|uniref:Sigma-70 family RNA polymerase sigma factor n=1 Tax=Agaribacillus aureus TaxID=3051825 RepID=A0ABT8L8H0_9BACT|nr:sigma-70 family RNA polymerase sigma factor [Fulvivirgaceae bacterium BMA12]